MANARKTQKSGTRVGDTLSGYRANIAAASAIFGDDFARRATAGFTVKSATVIDRRYIG